MKFVYFPCPPTCDNFEPIHHFSDYLKQFFCSCSSSPPSDYSSENSAADEALDCKVIDVLREAILAHPTHVPRSFLLNVMLILNKGSIHSAQSLAGESPPGFFLTGRSTLQTMVMKNVNSSLHVHFVTLLNHISFHNSAVHFRDQITVLQSDTFCKALVIFDERKVK
jgi:hypothetical protein